MAKEVLAEAAASLGQGGIARRTQIELQCLDLEHAARERLFTRASDFDFPFLPPAESLDADSPLLLYKSAARDLAAGGSDQHQRREALERAEKTLQGLLDRTLSAPRTDELSKRLIPTARIWLDVLRDEERKLAAEEAAHPQVPRVFIAGNPLTPERLGDQGLFKSRADLARLLDHDLAPSRRGVIVLVGQRRMGKSSFRNWLPRLLGTGTDVVVADFQGLSGEDHREAPHRWLLELIAARHPGAPPLPDGPRWGVALEWLRKLDGSPGDRRVLVVMDEVERVEDGIRAGWCSTDFLDFLRAAGDALRHIRFLLLTAYPLHRLGPHWTDRLISATSRSISYLDRAAAEELVRQPIPGFPDIYPEGGVERILRETHRHPYLVQKVCDELCKYLNEHGGRRRATDDELTEVLDGVVNDEVFDEIWRRRDSAEQEALRRLARAKSPLTADEVLRGLAREGYVELEGEQARLAVPLFGAWIRLAKGKAVPEAASDA